MALPGAAENEVLSTCRQAAATRIPDAVSKHEFPVALPVQLEIFEGLQAWGRVVLVLDNGLFLCPTRASIHSSQPTGRRADGRHIQGS